MNFIEYVKNEFEYLRKEDPGYIILNFENEIMDLAKKFSDQGLSGGSAPYYRSAVVSFIDNVFDYLPYSKLEKDDDNWVEHEQFHYQNKRCSAVFKDVVNGNPVYTYIDGIIFQYDDMYIDDDGTVKEYKSAFTTYGCVVSYKDKKYVIDSSVDVSNAFPFRPKRFYLNMNKKYDKITNLDNYEESNDDRTYTYELDDDSIKTLNDVCAYYNLKLEDVLKLKK